MNDKKQLVQAGLGWLWRDTYSKLSGPYLDLQTIADIQQKLADIDAAKVLIDEMPTLDEYRRLVIRHRKLEAMVAALEALLGCPLKAVREALNES